MQPTGEKIPFLKSNNFLRTWSEQTGEKGCQICFEKEVSLSLDRAAPPMRDQPPPKAEERTTIDGKVDEPNGMLYAGLRAVEGFRARLDTPPSPKPAKAPAATPAPATKKVPPFDLQDMPGAMRKLGMPTSAMLLEKWFKGQLNYSTTELDQQKEINQDGKPYPASMIDKTSIKMAWMLTFARAKAAYDELITERIYNQAAAKELSHILSSYRSGPTLLPWDVCDADIQQFHKFFQFQFMSVDKSWEQKLGQYLNRLALHKGVPDDLTGSLGSFNFYAAVSAADFNRASKTATVTHISVYVRDGFTFMDDPDSASQYLGHWNKSHVAIVPAHQAAVMGNVGWIDYPVTQGDEVLYPVKNKDFRTWQQQHKQGGDFMIYTDRVNLMLNPPITVQLE